MLQVQDKINNKLENDLILLERDGYCISNMRKAIKKLKTGKADGNAGLNSDSIIHGTHRLFTLLSLFFKVILIHGYVPDKLLLGTMCPIPKTRRLELSDNYRAITLISSILKLFDYIILIKFEDVFKTDPLQFGFKSKCSTTLCSSLLVETARIFNSNGSRVYALLLDASKAFDRVEFSKLFTILLDKPLNSLYVRCLLYMYSNQKMRVNWNGACSDTFYVTNGVKQGGVLSPMLFGLYLDKLIQNLRDSQYGCHIGPHFIGCLAYADDIVLMSPSKTGLENMLSICDKFSVDYKLKFNGSKSQYIIFEHKSSQQHDSITVLNSVIRNQDVVNHLGHKIFALTGKNDVDGIIAAFYKQFNFFRARFGGVASSIQAKLMHTHCSSFYGAILQPLKILPKLQVIWRKALRVVWNIPYRTHCSLLATLNNGLCDLHMFLARFVKFAYNAVLHKSEIISFIMRQSWLAHLSPFHNNVKTVQEKLKINDETMFEKGVRTPLNLIWKQCNEQCKSDTFNASVVNELADIRDNIMTLSNIPLSKAEISQILNELCVN